MAERISLSDMYHWWIKDVHDVFHALLSLIIGKTIMCRKQNPIYLVKAPYFINPLLSLTIIPYYRPHFLSLLHLTMTINFEFIKWLTINPYVSINKVSDILEIDLVKYKWPWPDPEGHSVHLQTISYDF